MEFLKIRGFYGILHADDKLAARLVKVALQDLHIIIWFKNIKIEFFYSYRPPWTFGPA